MPFFIIVTKVPGSFRRGNFVAPGARFARVDCARYQSQWSFSGLVSVARHKKSAVLGAHVDPRNRPRRKRYSDSARRFASRAHSAAVAVRSRDARDMKMNFTFCRYIRIAVDAA